MQLVATITAIVLAAAYLMRSVWRLVTAKKAGCASGCGKCSAPAPEEEKGRISLPQI